MSRPTDDARYAQANGWMAKTFGTTMPEYLTSLTQTPITRAVNDIVAVLDTSEATQLLNEWRREDALSNAGVKPYVTVTGALALLLLHMRLGRVPHIVAMTQTFHALNARNREALGLDHAVDQDKSYDRIWSAIQRFILLVDEYYVPEGAPRARHGILTGAEHGLVVSMRDPERCQRNRARMLELSDALLDGTIRLVPDEVFSRWEGNFAGDATVVAMLGRAGNPNPSDTVRKRRSINQDAGYYSRGGTHAGYTMEDAKHLESKGQKVTGASRSKLLWGIEVEVARMTRNTDDQNGDFPLFTVTLAFHPPGKLTGAGAAMAESLVRRGHPINYCIFDRAYPSGFVRDFHAPIRLLGGKLVFDYDSNEFGVRARDERGFVQIVGSWYLDNLPERLREIDKPMVDLRDKAKKPLSEISDAQKRLLKAQKKLSQYRARDKPLATASALAAVKVAQAELIAVQKLHSALIKQLDKAEKQYTKQVEHRNKFRLRPKGRMAPDGSRRYLVPDTSDLPVVGTHRFRGKTVTIDADITADGNPGGLKHEQHLTYGTPLWRRIYGLRNGVESVNRNYKRAQFDDLQNADRRHVRGNTFTYVIAALAAVCENLRKLLNFLKDHLALRPVNSKNSEVPTIFWQPEPRADDIEPPTRR